MQPVDLQRFAGCFLLRERRLEKEEKDKDKNLVGAEILGSSQLGSYLSLAYGGFGLLNLALGNPTEVWQHLRFNPWLAMDVYDDMEEKDDMIASCLEARKENVLSKSRQVLAASDKRQDKKLADFIDETLESYFDVTDGEHIGFDNLLWEALDAIGKGVSIGETIFAEAADRIFIKDVRFKPQQLFSFGAGDMAAYSLATYPTQQTGPLRLRPGIYGDGISSETALPERKFFVFSYRPRYSNRWGSPLLRKVYWLSWFKRQQARNWLRFGEKGAGTVLSRYPDGSPPDTQQKALDAARAIFEESVAAIPAKFQVEVLEQVRQAMGGTYKEFVDDFCNNGIARVILGQTLTSRGSEGGGSRALGEVHERVAEKKTEVDSKSLMLAVNTRLVWPLVLLNQGPVARPPIWTINYEPGKDLTTISDWLQRLWEMHVPIPRNWVYTTFQMPVPDENEETLPPPEKGEEKEIGPGGEGTGGGFAEGQKKKPAASRDTSSKQPNLKTERFARLRPSTMKA